MTEQQPVVITQKQFQDFQNEVNAAFILKQQHIEALEKVVMELKEKIETLQDVLITG